jgi:hypothetical protein
VFSESPPVALLKIIREAKMIIKKRFIKIWEDKNAAMEAYLLP